MFVITIYTYTPTHPATHTHIHTYTHTHTHTIKASPHRMRALLYMPLHRGSCEYTSTQPHTHTHTHARARAYLYIIYNINTHIEMQNRKPGLLWIKWHRTLTAWPDTQVYFRENGLRFVQTIKGQGIRRTYEAKLQLQK